MRRVLRWGGYLLASLFALVLLAAAWVWFASNRALTAAPSPQAAQLKKPTAEELANGSRQLRVLGCVGCHGQGLRGRLFLDLPGIAKIHAPNLTLVAARASDEQLEHGIRQGIGSDGRPLLVMPSEGYQFMTDSETAALIAAIRALPKGGAEQPPVTVQTRGRIGLALGKLKPAPAVVSEFHASPIPSVGPQFDRGRHIVQVNCAECHGPKLTGNKVEPGVMAPDLEIAAAYDLNQFRTMMRTGVAPGGKDIGLMGRIARRDFKYMTDAEIADVHAYLAERARRR